MAIELLIPKPRLIVPKPPSYVKLDLAFGVGAGTTLFDKSRYRSHGAITGPDWVTGLHGYALDFVTANFDYVTIPATATQLNFTSEDFSILARVNFDSLAGYRGRVFIRGGYAEDGYDFSVWTDGHIRARTFQAGGLQSTLSSSGDVTTGSWYTIGLSRDGSSIKLFRNGVDVTLTSGTHVNPTTSTRSAKIGVYDDLSSAMDGKMEFMRVLGGIALSASEHLAYHNALK